MCQALGIKGGTRTDPRPYCPRPPWQLPNHVTLYLNTHGHSPELTAPPTIHMLAYLLGLKISYVLLMGLINVAPKSITLRHTQFSGPERQDPGTYPRLIRLLKREGRFNICGLDLHHTGSEPFQLSSNW